MKRKPHPATPAPSLLSAVTVTKITEGWQRRGQLLSFISQMQSDNATGQPFSLTGQQGTICVLLTRDAIAVRSGAILEAQKLLTACEAQLTALNVSLAEPVKGK